jgi:hypothetical protein
VLLLAVMAVLLLARLS